MGNRRLASFKRRMRKRLKKALDIEVTPPLRTNLPVITPNNATNSENAPATESPENVPAKGNPPSAINTNVKTALVNPTRKKPRLKAKIKNHDLASDSYLRSLLKTVRFSSNEEKKELLAYFEDLKIRSKDRYKFFSSEYLLVFYLGHFNTDSSAKSEDPINKPQEIATKENSPSAPINTNANPATTPSLVAAPIIVGQRDNALEISTQVPTDKKHELMTYEESCYYKKYARKPNTQLRKILSEVELLSEDAKNDLLRFFNVLKTYSFNRYKNLYPVFQTAFKLEPLKLNTNSPAKSEIAAIPKDTPKKSAVILREYNPEDAAKKSAEIFREYDSKSNNAIRELLKRAQLLSHQKKKDLLIFFDILDTYFKDRFNELRSDFLLPFFQGHLDTDSPPNKKSKQIPTKNLKNTPASINKSGDFINKSREIATKNTASELIFFDDEDWNAEEEEDEDKDVDEIKEPSSKRPKITTDCAAATQLFDPFSGALSVIPEDNPFFTPDPFPDALSVTPEKKPILVSKQFSKALSVQLEEKPFSAACEDVEINNINIKRRKLSHLSVLRNKLRNAGPLNFATMNHEHLILFLDCFYNLPSYEQFLIDDHMKNVERYNPGLYEILRTHLQTTNSEDITPNSPAVAKLTQDQMDAVNVNKTTPIQPQPTSSTVNINNSTPMEIHNNDTDKDKLNSVEIDTRYDPFEISEPEEEHEEEDPFKLLDLALQQVSAHSDPFNPHIEQTNNYSNAHNSSKIPTQSQLQTKSNYIDLTFPYPPPVINPPISRKRPILDLPVPKFLGEASFP